MKLPFFLLVPFFQTKKSQIVFPFASHGGTAQSLEKLRYGTGNVKGKRGALFF